MSDIQPFRGPFPTRDNFRDCHHLKQSSFQHRANSASEGIVQSLMEPRRTLGKVMIECSQNMNVPPNGHFMHQESYRPFFEKYYAIREMNRATSNVQIRSIKQWLLDGSQGFFRFRCPVDRQNESRNVLMVIINCLTRDDVFMSNNWDRYTGNIECMYDCGTLIHLAIRLQAPGSVIRVLVDDSCGLGLNVKGKVGTVCDKPPFSLITTVTGHRFHLDGLQTMVYLGVKFMWCLPFLYKYSVWRIVKILSTYPHPCLRRTSDILMDYKFNYNPVIKFAIDWDREQARNATQNCVRVAFEFGTLDQGGTGTTLVMRLIELCAREDIFDPIYETIREDPGSFIASIRWLTGSSNNAEVPTDVLPDTFVLQSELFHLNNQDNSNDVDDEPDDVSYGREPHGNDPFEFDTNIEDTTAVDEELWPRSDNDNPAPDTVNYGTQEEHESDDNVSFVEID